MPLWRTINDEEYVARIRRFESKRGIYGAIILILGIAMLAYTYHTGINLYHQELNSIGALDQMQSLCAKSEFVAGVALGFIAGKSIAIGMALALTGIGIILGDRKTRLLLACLKKSSG